MSLENQQAMIELISSCLQEQATEAERKWPTVAILAGRSHVIEVIVALASVETQIPMNWGYFGGRAHVFSQGDPKKCRAALRRLIPETNIQTDEVL